MPNSGNAEVVPLVASEKNVDACVVSIGPRPGVRRLHRQAAAATAGAARRPARCTRSRRRCSSARWSRSCGLGRGVPAAGKSSRAVGLQRSASARSRRRCATDGCRATPRSRPSRRSSPAAAAAALTFHTCMRGFSRSHCTGRIELPTPRSNGGVGKRRIGDDDARRRRRVGHRDDQVLLVVGVEVQAVAAAQRGRAVAEDIPGGADARRQILERRVLVELADRRRRDRSG